MNMWIIPDHYTQVMQLLRQKSAIHDIHILSVDDRLYDIPHNILYSSRESLLI